MVNHPEYKRVMPAWVAHEVGQVLTTVVQSGTATQAEIPGVFAAGKTGTTSNYGDAWFVGWTPKLTVAVWVGYPNKLIPMLTQWDGGPVEGGDFPAAIWHNFMVSALQILTQEQAEQQGSKTSTTTTPETIAPTGPTGSGQVTPPTVTTPATTTPATPTTAPTPTTPATTAPATTPGTGGTTGGTQGTGGTTGGVSGGAAPASGGAGVGSSP
jgi:penicillin-binding protein 1A